MAGPALARNTKIAVEMESVYGEATPVPFPIAANFKLVYGDSAAAYKATQEFIDVSALTGTLTPQAQQPSIARAEAQVMCYVQGSGTPTTGPATAPYYDELLRGCGLEHSSAPELTPDIRTVHSYKFRDTGFESVRIAVFHEHVRGGLAGGYGNLRMEGTAGQPIKATFSMSGQVRDIKTDVPATFTAPASRAMRLMKTGLNFSGHVDGSYGAPNLFARSMVIDLGWTIVDRPDFAQLTSEQGLAGRMITARQPTFELVIEAETDLSHYDPFKRLLKGDTSEIISLTCKSLELPAQDEWRVAVNNPYLTTVDRQETDSAILYTLSFNMQNGSPKNELSMAWATIDGA